MPGVFHRQHTKELGSTLVILKMLVSRKGFCLRAGKLGEDFWGGLALLRRPVARDGRIGKIIAGWRGLDSVPAWEESALRPCPRSGKELVR
jgi:hypothetical protein